jgi:centrosomal protein CEP104
MSFMYRYHRFRVVHSSSEDSGYPSSELNAHSPSTRGWQSDRFCQFPQELGFELVKGESKLSQVQILSHQSKIATKIEIFLGQGHDYHSANFKRLGYLSLDSNERSSFQARELKTVYIDQSGRFIKLLIHKNYVNKQNMFSQVGIVALNLLGSEEDNSPQDNRNKQPLYVNPLNDLSIDMNLDPPTAEKLRLLSDAKAKAVATEDYTTAKKIKAVEGELKTLGRLELE